MNNLKEAYEKSVFELQELNQQIQTVRQRLERQVETYRLGRLKDKQTNYKNKRSRRLASREKLSDARQLIDELSLEYRELLQTYDRLQDRQTRIREQLIENNAQVGETKSKQISHDVIILRNLYEAIRVGESSAEMIDTLLAFIREKKEREWQDEEQLIHLSQTFDERLIELTRFFVQFDAELADLVELDVDSVTDYQSTENFWPILNEIKDKLQDEGTILKSRPKIESLMLDLRHTVHLILLDLETHKNILELDLIN